MTQPPPPDPIFQPSPPPIDPVLQPPAPMPWEKPWQPAPPAEPPTVPPEPSEPAPSTPYRRQPTPKRTQPNRTQPTRTQPSRTQPTPTWTPPSPTRPAPTRTRRRRRRIPLLGVVIAMLLIIGNVVTNRNHNEGPARGGPILVLPQPSRRPPTPEPAMTTPIATVDGGPASFALPIGTAVRFSDQDGTWTVALLGVAWIDECTNFLGDSVKVVAFDIRYQVTEGAVSAIPATDFAFSLENGTKVRPSLLFTCAEPALDTAIFAKPDVRHGWVSIELPAGTRPASGVLSYGQLGAPTATWAVPIHAGQ